MDKDSSTHNILSLSFPVMLNNKEQQKTIQTKKVGLLLYCCNLQKPGKPGNDENNCLYVLKDINSDRQVTVDLTTLDWSPLRKEQVET